MDAISVRDYISKPFCFALWRCIFAFVAISYLSACSSEYDIKEMLNEWWKKNPACLITYGKFPITLPEMAASKYGPILDEFVNLGYASSTKVRIETNHDPAKPSNIVDAKRYELTSKGQDLAQGFRICYGDFETVKINKDEGILADPKGRRMVSFDFRITNLTEWVRESDKFVMLSDQLYDDLHTQQVNAKGVAIIGKRKDGTWQIFDVKEKLERVSEDPSTDRNRRIFREKSEEAYLALKSLDEDLTLEDRAKAFNVFLSTYPWSEHDSEVRSEYLRLNQAIGNLQRELQRQESDLLSKLVREFASAIDRRDNDALNSLTVSGKAARNALNNNLFERYKIGHVAMTSFKYYGNGDSLVQMQVDGGIRMVRAERFDGKWLITGYETQSNSWFKSR